MVVKSRLLLDTNIAIKYLNGNVKWSDYLDQVNQIFLSVIVCGELLYGARNSGRPEKNARIIDSYISTCELLTINRAVSDEYSKIRFTLKKIGKPIPENDIWIAAIAQVNRIGLATNDKHFDYIPDLDIVTF